MTWFVEGLKMVEIEGGVEREWGVGLTNHGVVDSLDQSHSFSTIG
jgi:hypothetical protein